MGVIHHGAVSNFTSLYCGGHVASRKESTIDCVKILLFALSGALIESQISLNRTNFFGTEAMVALKVKWTHLPLQRVQCWWAHLSAWNHFHSHLTNTQVRCVGASKRRGAPAWLHIGLSEAQDETSSLHWLIEQVVWVALYSCIQRMHPWVQGALHWSHNVKMRLRSATSVMMIQSYRTYRQ